jgi:hypothetical protein
VLTLGNRGRGFESLPLRQPKLRKSGEQAGKPKRTMSKVDDYINQQPSPQKEICQRLRELILKVLPEAKEEMRWGVPVFGDGKFYIAPLKDKVNLGFAINGLTKEEIALFEGGGKTMRHIKVFAVADIDEEKIAGLLKLVDKKAKC